MISLSPVEIFRIFTYYAVSLLCETIMGLGVIAFLCILVLCFGFCACGFMPFLRSGGKKQNQPLSLQFIYFAPFLYSLIGTLIACISDVLVYFLYFFTFCEVFHFIFLYHITAILSDISFSSLILCLPVFNQLCNSSIVLLILATMF